MEKSHAQPLCTSLYQQCFLCFLCFFTFSRALLQAPKAPSCFERDRNLGPLQVLMPAHVIAALNKARWQVELFFKWVKQHLHIQAFFGTSENAVKIRVWITVSVYVLIAILHKRLLLEHLNLNQVSQVLSMTVLEKTRVNAMFLNEKAPPDEPQIGNQLSFL